MGDFLQFLLGWGTPAALTGTHLSTFFDALSTGATIPQSWWEGTVASFTSTPAVVESVVASIFAGLISLLPTGGGFPQPFHDAASAFGNVFQAMAFIFPTDVLAYCIILVIEIRFALWALQIVIRIFNWLRGVGTERMDTSFMSDDQFDLKYGLYKN